jgi:4'-phosphopantetheinyl transferase
LSEAVTSRAKAAPVADDPAADGVIDAWFADLDPVSTNLPAWQSLLSAEEHDRASRLRAPLDRERFVASRGILRTLLGRTLLVAPEAITFAYGSHGKPYLPGCGLHFNLSHSHGRALFAFSPKSPLGVDLELVRMLPDLAQLGASIFSPAEAHAFDAIAAENRPAAFFKCWTRKEAVLKAIGAGLSYPLDRLTVSFDEPARVIAFDGDAGELTAWHLHHLEPEQGYFAAVATREPRSRIVLHRFS